MSNFDNEGGSVGSNADAFRRPEPRLLKPHLFAGHDLIPLNRPNASRSNKHVGKAPRDNNWRKRDYSGQNPGDWMADGFNVGVRLQPNQLVIDVDPRNFGGKDRLSELCKTFGIRVEDYPYVRSGGGGTHIYMAKSSELQIRKTLRAFPGIDFMTSGSHLVAAGSVHPETGRHYFAEDLFGELLHPPSAPESLLKALARTANSKSTGNISSGRLGELLAVLQPTNFGQYDDWLRLMMACHHATRGDGLEEFVAWSVLDPRYAGDAETIRAKWGSLSFDRANQVTGATLFKAVVDAGHPELVAGIARVPAEHDFGQLLDITDVRDLKLGRDGRPAATLTNCLKVLEHAKFGFAYDELARRYLLRAESLPWSIDIGRELNDELIRVIRHYLIESAGIEFSKDNVVEGCLTLARQSPFNPVVDYLASLRWDRTPRVDEWLVRYLGADDTEYVRAIGRLALLAAVRRARKPGCKFDNVLILEGTQGTGKSSALRLLGGEWFSDAELGRVDSKEAALVLQGVWIHELGELTAMGRGEVENLKAFVSRCEDRFRTPFDRMAHTDPRRCVFIGTTNAGTYLFDQTGNRRFWPVKTGVIDLPALASDRDQLWAEASEAEAAGETISLAPHLWTMAAEAQAARLATDPWRDDLILWLDGYRREFDGEHWKTTRTEPVERIHSRDLLMDALHIDTSRQNQHIAKRLREVMRTIDGWTYKQGIRIDGKGNAAGYQRNET